ncbi:hypothetical protein DFH06DRAFT_1332687 [Mycena polygramma]|nr:hypothetical protein DFH06DRAFT_1332687 [Mycena polygramma]
MIPRATGDIPRVRDPVSPGPGSSDEYEQELDPSDEDDVVSKPPARTKKSAKGEIRRAVEDARDAQRQQLIAAERNSDGKGKRKASLSNPDVPAQKKPKASAQSSVSKPEKKSLANALGGLRDEWTRGRTPGSSRVSQRSQSAGSAMSVDPLSESDYGAPPPGSEYQDSSEGMGGVDSDKDSGDEKQWASSHGQQKVGRRLGAARQLDNLSQITALAGIVDTDAPGLVPLRRAKPGGLTKKQIKHAHLPEPVRNHFNTKFKPVLIRWAAGLPPWDDTIQSWEDIAGIWRKVFPDYALEDEEDLQPVAVKLSEDKLNTWRHNFGTVATTSLGDALDDWNLTTLEDRAQMVESLLEKADDGTRVFYWRQYHEEAARPEGDEADDEAEAPELVVNPKGLFGNHLIIDGLASHFKAAYPRGLTSSKDLRDEPVPAGPLVYSIQAAHRALNCFKTGKLVVPAQRLGEFSKTNWADRSLVLGGESIPVRTTSELLDFIKDLKDKQWVRILDAAIAASQASHKASKAMEVIDVDALTAPPRRVVVDNDSD